MYQENLSTRFLTQSSSARFCWNLSEEKQFEKALVQFSEDLPDRWQQIADCIGKSVQEVTEHYEELVRDVNEIDSGRVELPCYRDGNSCWESMGAVPSEISFGGKSNKQADSERKKGTPWTEHEHRLFLIGLHRYGKGDWRSISRNVVITRTPTQVASHAQKYFLRQNSMSMKKERKRSSIHDITTVDDKPVPLPIDQSWIPPPGAPVQQLSGMQDAPMPPAGHFPNQGGSMGYQNYDFHM
ncbi:transcription factor SRM1 [Ricinus communis]|uniref:DNA binding protein, putative n=1 Tax=Ricinus communis TaxID=3988 RepID=B9RPV0_RICCO|nr:transcription factor SRM1 [Ricinus communis]EEF46608.1 DNA binding protein, putative [Ricinus communis]|eukprot:XP_002515769.1 transcription factor SRM1 [Ricinus communis]